MKEHDILDALGQVSEETIEKYALPKSDAPNAAGKGRITMTQNSEKAKPVRISKAAIAAAVALCIGLNGAIIYGVSQMRRDANTFTPGMAPQIQDMNQPYMDVTLAMPTGVQIELHNTTAEDITLTKNFAVYQGEQKVADCDESVMGCDVLASKQDYVTIVNFEQLPAGEYTLYHLSEDGTQLGTFGSANFEITSDYDSMTWIPDITGMDYDEAKQMLHEKGIDSAEIVYSVFSDETLPKNQIFAMNVYQVSAEQPDAQDDPNNRYYDGKGYWVDENTSIRVDVNIGAKGTAVQMPDVTNWEFENARTTLLGLGLYIDKRMSYSSEVPEGKVISTDPAGETEVAAGDYVTVTVSLGENGGGVPVPNFVGVSWTMAQTTADDMKITLAKNEVESEEPIGTVLAQDVEVGTEISEGTVVTLTVSKGMGDDEKQVRILYDVPAKASGQFYIELYKDGKLAAVGGVFNTEYAAGMTSLILYGSEHESGDYTAVLKNVEDGTESKIGMYHVDFENRDYQVISEDVEAAFRAVGGIKE